MHNTLCPGSFRRRKLLHNESSSHHWPREAVSKSKVQPWNFRDNIFGNPLWFIHKSCVYFAVTGYVHEIYSYVHKSIRRSLRCFNQTKVTEVLSSTSTTISLSTIPISHLCIYHRHGHFFMTPPMNSSKDWNTWMSFFTVSSSSMSKINHILDPWQLEETKKNNLKYSILNECFNKKCIFCSFFPYKTITW